MSNTQPGGITRDQRRKLEDLIDDYANAACVDPATEADRRFAAIQGFLDTLEQAPTNAPS